MSYDATGQLKLFPLHAAPNGEQPAPTIMVQGEPINVWGPTALIDQVRAWVFVSPLDLISVCFDGESSLSTVEIVCFGVLKRAPQAGRLIVAGDRKIFVWSLDQLRAAAAEMQAESPGRAEYEVELGCTAQLRRPYQKHDIDRIMLVDGPEGQQVGGWPLD